MLPGRVRKAVKRGEVRQLSDIQEYLPGLAEVYVRRLKSRPPRWRRPLIAVAVALIVAGAVLWALALILHALAVALAPALVVLAVAWLIFHFASEHDTHCPGWHCPGCRG
jgi:CHASE2 domain-containing sensor protein